MTTKEEILTILEAHKGKNLSGSRIAEEIHVTRSAVWKGIKALQDEGYPITAVTGRGYSLDESSDIFSAAAVSARLTGAASHLTLTVRQEVTSTNTILKEAARQGAAHGTVLVARAQTAGKGRLGRSFYSPTGTGLYLSLLLRPDMTLEHSIQLTTVAAVATARAIEDVTGEPVDIKWVNDVYRNGKKLCGILTEASVNFEGGALEYAVVGIGVNLSDPEEGFPEAIRDVAASLYGTGHVPDGSQARLCAGILNYFMEYYEKLPETAFLSEYRRRSFLLGKDIYVLKKEGPVRARAESIDERVRLVVAYPDGSREALSSGEVSVCPAAP